MADKEVKIDFKTTADTKGAKKVEKEIKEVGKASKKQGRDSQQSARQTDDALEMVEMTARDLREELERIDGIDPNVKKQVKGVADSMDRAAVSGRKLAGSHNKATKSQKNSGLAALEFSRAVEDAQYGIRGVLNNLPSLIQFMGGGPGLAGVVSLAAVGLTTLVSVLFKTEEKVEEVADSFETARDQIDEFYRIAAKDRSGAMQASMSALADGLDDQSDALRRNLGLLQKKRQAELDIAKLTEDLELQKIIAGEAGGQITGEQADEARRQIEIKRVQREAEENILKAQEAVKIAQDQRLAAAKEEQYLDKRRIKKKEELEKVRDRLFALQSQELIAQEEIEEGRKILKKNAGIDLNPLSDRAKQRGIGQVLEETGRERFTEADRKERIELEIQLKELGEAVKTLETARDTAESRKLDLSVIQGEAFNVLKIEEETQTRSAELKTEIINTKAAAEQTMTAVNALSTGISQLETASKEAGEKSQADKKLVEVSLSQMRKVMEDGDITARELAETGQVLGGLSLSVVGATKENNLMINNLQTAVSQLQAAQAVTKAENTRLQTKINQLGGRQ